MSHKGKYTLIDNGLGQYCKHVPQKHEWSLNECPQEVQTDGYSRRWARSKMDKGKYNRKKSIDECKFPEFVNLPWNGASGTFEKQRSCAKCCFCRIQRLPMYIDRERECVSRLVATGAFALRI